MEKYWRIDLFGGVQLCHPNGVITHFATRKTAALLAYLAYFCDRPHSREVLAELLWPEADLEAQRNSFRVALSSLRRQLEPLGQIQGDVLIADRTTLHLHPDAFVTDVQLFECALRQKNWEEAITLYRAPLLVGWYEDWIDVERSRLAGLFAQALRQRTAQLWAAGERSAALTTARHAVQTDPLDEENYRTLLPLLARAGRTEEAWATFDTLTQLLQEELGRGPSALTRTLMHNLPPEEPEPQPQPEPLALAPAPQPSPAQPRHGSLPTPLTRFFGREDELAQLTPILTPGGQRLVTLAGPGGVGKTRLALALGHALWDAYAGQVWFLSLGDESPHSPLAPWIATKLRLDLAANADPLAATIQHFQTAPTSLLILDNMEDALEGLVPLVESLLLHCPGLSCLVTSRTILQITGEYCFPVAPLPLPADQTPPEQLAACPSIALLLDRAQAVRPDFQLTPRNSAQLTQLCRTLDGWPLALELVATWAWTLTLPQMLARLAHRFDVLVSEQRSLPARQRSLRSVMEAALELLDPSTRSTLLALSVFSGGFTAEQASTIVGPHCLSALPILQRHALLYSEETPTGIQFCLRELVRDYAAHLLPPTDATRLRAAHAGVFLDATRQARQQWDRQNSDGPRAFFAHQRENLLAALRYGTPEQATALLAAGWPLWYASGFAAEGITLLEHALTRTPHAPQAWLGLGRLLVAEGRLEEALAALHKSERQSPVGSAQQAQATFQFALLARELGDTALARAAFQRFATTQAHDPWASAWAREELAQLDDSPTAEAHDDLGHVLLRLSFIATMQCELDTARTLAEEALQFFHQQRDPHGAQNALERLAYIAQHQGDQDSAQRTWETLRTLSSLKAA